MAYLLAKALFLAGAGRSVSVVEIVESALHTPDGMWRVEIVRRGRAQWYRIVHGDDAMLDWLSIAAVQRILDDAGVDIATLVEAEQDIAVETHPYADGVGR